VTGAREDGQTGLLGLLDLQPGAESTPAAFTAFDDGRWPGGAMFGGQLAAQSLVAASRTVRPELQVHSLHAYFIRPGAVPGPVEFVVDRLRDGGSFSTRSVSVAQDGRELARVMFSFHVDEPSESYQLPMPPDAGAPLDVPRSPGLEDLRMTRGLESRELDAVADSDGSYRATRRSWLRFTEPVPEQRALHQAIMTFMSDIGAHFSARLPVLGPTPRANSSHRVLSVSIDHAVWFHQPARADEWLYYELQALTHQNSRAVTRGRFYTESGALVASVAQELLIRMLDARAHEADGGRTHESSAHLRRQGSR